ncbi:MAG: hypothetical protein JNL79_04070 [Myxococcales bacterium]|nr:hypothetical protein [Myxococcales bacterium]
MTTTPRPKTKAQLDALRLPELQALFAEATGEATRCPNRTFLVRKILEARTAPPRPAATSTITTETSVAPIVQRIEPIGTMRILGPDEPSPVTTEASDPPTPGVQTSEAIAPLWFMGPEPGAMDGSPAPETKATEASEARPATAPGRRRRAPRGAYRTMTVPELREAYVAIVGRPTESTDRNYLIWKIREAEKGRVPVGPREDRKRKNARADDTMQILPLRASSQQVQALDTAWKSAGLKSRMHFLRAAIKRELKRLGAPEAAELFAQ